MRYTDTRDESVDISFREAVMGGMNGRTGGLYIPRDFPAPDAEFFGKADPPSFKETAFAMAAPFVEGEIPAGELENIISDSYPFSPITVAVGPRSYILELFHGPTCAFKDFGARFMARVMSYFNRAEDTPLHILVATSGDTGSAVGSAFHNVPGIDVTILFPKGKISKLQEKQLSTFDGNVRALRVDGTFDDCQRLVKAAFTDPDLRVRLRLSSANSINIARLLPQAFYYMHAALTVKRQVPSENPSIIVTVPSGNFGNLTSGLIAREMGAPIRGFIAATNENRTVPDWIATGVYRTRPSVPTLSNAMDVGAPSNYERIAKMYTLKEVRRLFAAYWTDDDGTLESISDCKKKTGYTIDPHGAVAWRAWSDICSGAMEALLSDASRSGHAAAVDRAARPGLVPNAPLWAKDITDGKAYGIVLETAHPAKFGDTVFKALGIRPTVPERLERVLSLPDMAHDMSAEYDDFKAWLTSTLP